jgi:hypothetical protein
MCGAACAMGQRCFTSSQRDHTMDGWYERLELIRRLWLCDDVAILHIKIDKLNNLLVGFCFIRSIDSSMHKSPDQNHCT